MAGQGGMMAGQGGVMAGQGGMMGGQAGMMGQQQPGMMNGGMMMGGGMMSQQLALYNPHQNRPPFMNQTPYGQQVSLTLIFLSLFLFLSCEMISRAVRRSSPNGGDEWWTIWSQ